MHHGIATWSHSLYVIIVNYFSINQNCRNAKTFLDLQAILHLCLYVLNVQLSLPGKYTIYFPKGQIIFCLVPQTRQSTTRQLCYFRRFTNMCLLLGTFCMFLVLVTNLGIIIKTAKQLPIGKFVIPLTEVAKIKQVMCRVAFFH